MSYKLSTAKSGRVVNLRRESILNPGEYQDLACPFQPQFIACGEWCPHFEIERFLENKLRVCISCTPTRRMIAIDSEDSPCGS